jgi:spore coat-associated protein N
VTASTTARERRGRRRRALLLLATGSALLSFSAGQLSLALFTDQASVDGDFTSGTISIDETKIAALSLTSASMMPGDNVTGAVVVENDGSAELRYAVSTSSTNVDAKGLRDVLTLTVRTIDVTTPGTPCDDFDGTVVLNATVLGASSAGVGSNAAGQQTGDRVLASGASETLCFRVSLPLATGDAYQGASTTTTFTFDAEQTANNP